MLVARPYSCGGMDDDRFMGKASFRLIRDHPNPAVRAAVARALVVGGFDVKAQADLPNEVVLYPTRTDDEQRRMTHQAIYEAYAHAIRPTFPGMASQMLAELLAQSAAEQAKAATAAAPAVAEPAVARDHHGIPVEIAERAAELGTGEVPPGDQAAVDRHGFQVQAGKVHDWASEQAALKAMQETPPIERETAEAGPVQEIVKAPGRRRAVKLTKGGRPAAIHKGEEE
jgi:hypothetical protein